MSKLMWVLGLILVVVGAALGAKSIISPGQMQIYGLTPETAAILFVGGVLSFGFAGLLGHQHHSHQAEVTPSKDKPRVIAAETSGEGRKQANVESQIRPAGFNRRPDEASNVTAAATLATATVAAAVVEPVAPVVTGSVADTIAALEQAKSDIKTALGSVESLSQPEEPPTPVSALPELAVEEAPVVAEGELYVVEEKIIRGRPSRILSDDTVEAETEEGWMRFENLEHLNEYLDSMETGEV
jgi:hypothetical protein